MLRRLAASNLRPSGPRGGWSQQRAALVNLASRRLLLDAAAKRSLSTQQSLSHQQPPQDATAWLLMLATATGLAAVATAAAQCEPSRPSKLNRTNSLRGGIPLEEKYNIEWHIVLGEGAYGSVHPARLAATGEKVGMLNCTMLDVLSIRCVCCWPMASRESSANKMPTQPRCT